MNNQLWLINTLLLSAFAFSGCYLYYAQPRIPAKVHLTIPLYETTTQDKPPVVDAIYERDLFNAMPVLADEEKAPRYTPQTFIKLPSLPRPPQAIKEEDLTLPAPQFLPPLPLVLKGTILSNNSAYNRIFIENIKTKEEKSAQLGDVIEDAQVVFIGKNKAIFIRSNGQEETLYTNSATAEEERNSSSNLAWHKIIIAQPDNTLGIDLQLLSKRTPTISHFIEEVDMVTAFKGAVPLGCQVGEVKEGSLAEALGLSSHDLITHIDDIPTATAEDRITLYENLVHLAQINDTNHILRVRIKRNEKEVLLQYRLLKTKPLSPFEKGGKTRGISGFTEKTIKREHSYQEYLALNQVESSQPYAQTAQNKMRNSQKEYTSMGSREHVIHRSQSMPSSTSQENL